MENKPYNFSKIEHIIFKKEQELFLNFQKNSSKENIQEIMKNFNAIIIHYALKYHQKQNFFMTEEEAIQEARIATLEAIYKFDPKNKEKARFGTYIRKIIKGQILKFVMNYSGQMRVGTNLNDRKTYFKYAKKCAEIQTTKRIDQTDREEFSKTENIPLKVIERLEPRILRKDISLNSEHIKIALKSSNKKSYFLDLKEKFILNHQSDENDQNKDISLFLNYIEKYKKELSKREIIILNNYFLDKPKTKVQLAKKLKVTPTTIRNTEIEMFDFLKEKLKQHNLTKEDIPF